MAMTPRMVVSRRDCDISCQGSWLLSPWPLHHARLASWQTSQIGARLLSSSVPPHSSASAWSKSQSSDGPSLREHTAQRDPPARNSLARRCGGIDPRLE